MDSRFRGWGMEDVAFGRACHTILGPTVYGNEEVVSLYHPRPSESVRGRVWKGEEDVPSLDNHPNIELAKQYDGAVNDRDAMLRVVQQHRLRRAQVQLSGGDAIWQAVDPKNVVIMPTSFFEATPWLHSTADEPLSIQVDQEHEDTFTMKIMET
jgi:hypothetical protein